jgi:hypothetical protein
MLEKSLVSNCRVSVVVSDELNTLIAGLDFRCTIDAMQLG